MRQAYDAAGRPSVTSVGTVADASDAAWGGFAEADRATSQYDARGLVVRRTLWSNGVDYGVSDYLYDALGRATCTVVRMDPAAWGPLASGCTPPQTDGPAGPTG